MERFVLLLVVLRLRRAVLEVVELLLRVVAFLVVAFFALDFLVAAFLVALFLAALFVVVALRVRFFVVKAEARSAPVSVELSLALDADTPPSLEANTDRKKHRYFIHPCFFLSVYPKNVCRYRCGLSIPTARHPTTSLHPHHRPKCLARCGRGSTRVGYQERRSSFVHRLNAKDRFHR